MSLSASPRLRFELDNVLGLALGLVFLGTGVAKLASTEFVVSTFGGWPFPTWALFALGVAEVAAGALVLTPNTRLSGAAAITVLMVGAVGYHVSRVEFGLLLIPMAVLVASAGVVSLRLTRTARDEELERSPATPGLLGP